MPNPQITPAYSASVLPGTFPGDLGIELTEIEDTHVVGRMPVDRRHLHIGGVVHGGVWAAFADTVAGWGAMRLLDPGAAFTTSEMKTNLFGAGKPGDVLIGRGVALHAGRRTQVWEVRVTREADDRPMAHFLCTQISLAT